MELDDRKRLKKNYCLLVDNLQFSEIQDLLYQKNVLDDEDVELIESKPTRKGKNRELLKIIKGKKGVFEDFCVVLRECEADYGYIATALQNTEIVDNDEDLVDGTEQPYKEKVDQLMTQMWSQTQTMVEMQKQHRLEVEDLKKQLNTASASKESVDGRFLTTYVAEFMKRPSNKEGFLWNRFMSMFRPESLTEIENIACHLGIDVMQYCLTFTDHKITMKPMDKYTEVMRFMTKRVLDEHGEKLKSCVADMDIQEMSGYLAIDSLADELFEDNKKINWGRIVAWYAFWGKCVSSLPDSVDITQFVDFYGKFVGFYLARRLHGWIADQGGWGGFIEYYRTAIHPEDMQRGQISYLGILGHIFRGLMEHYPYRP